MHRVQWARHQAGQATGLPRNVCPNSGPVRSYHSAPAPDPLNIPVLPYPLFALRVLPPPDATNVADEEKLSQSSAHIAAAKRLSTTPPSIPWISHQACPKATRLSLKGRETRARNMMLETWYCEFGVGKLRVDGGGRRAHFIGLKPSGWTRYVHCECSNLVANAYLYSGSSWI